MSDMIRTTIRLFVLILYLNSILIKGDNSFNVESDDSSAELSSLPTPMALVSFKCPEQFGYYPDTSNCTKYFVCVFGEPLHETCTGGLYFSSELQTCDWPINVRCATDTKDKSFNSDDLDGISRFQTFDPHQDTKRLEYTTNDSREKLEDEKQYFDGNYNRFDFKPVVSDAEDLNANEFMKRKSINNSNQNKTTASAPPSTTPVRELDYNRDVKTQTNDELIEGKVEDSIDSNKLFREDLQNPDFEEAIASYVDENGGIHLHDGPGGLYGLVPPHTVSDHHIDVFSRPAIQDNREKLVKEKSNPIDRKVEKYNDFDRIRTPKVVHFDDDEESEIMSESIRKDLANKEVQTTDDHRIETKTVVTENPKQFQFSFDWRRNTNQTLNETKAKPIDYQNHRPLKVDKNANKFNFNGFTNNYNLSTNTMSYSKSTPETITRQPRPQPQRLQPQKYFKINAQKIVDLNPLVKYIKTLDQAIHLEPIPLFSVDYNHHKSRETAMKQQMPVAKKSSVATTPASVFYSYRYNSDAYQMRKVTTTPMPFNVTQYRRATPPTSTMIASFMKSTTEKYVTTKRPFVNMTSIKTSVAASVPSRPIALFPTPDAFNPAVKCIEKSCRLPDCFCGGTNTPVGLTAKQIPQIIVITFDDAVNDVNWHIYEQIFTDNRKNPNGCPIRGTFFVSHEWTDYGQVQTLYSRGHEIASHSITHSFGEKFSKSQWIKEINGQRDILHTFAGVRLEDIRGMRAPFLQVGGNKQFEMLFEANFTYDSSMAIFDNSPPFWPYTLDYQINHECMIAPCPTKSFPGLWEIGLVMWKDLNGGRCSMGDACSNPSDETGVYDMIRKNFDRHYESNRAPFGLFYHSAWFNTRHHLQGFLKFVDEVLKLNDVYFVTNWQLIQWMREPTPLSRIHKFNPWKCQLKDESRPNACHNPTVCNVASKQGSRFFKTCQPCPEAYPWIGNTGAKKKNSL